MAHEGGNFVGRSHAVDHHPVLGVVGCQAAKAVRGPLMELLALRLDPVRSSAVITLTFPVHEEVRTFTLDEYGPRGEAPKSLGTYKYRVAFKAATAMTVTSIEGDQTTTYDRGKLEVLHTYSAYQDRGYLAGNAAPMKKVQQVAMTKVIRAW